MANEVEHRTEPTMTSLVTGIVNDAQELIKQQFAMFKAEVRDDVRRAKDGALSLGIGAGAALLGAFLISFALAHLLEWATAWPGWACEGLVGLVFIAVGASLYFAARKQFEHALPEQSVEALKENVQWLTRPK